MLIDLLHRYVKFRFSRFGIKSKFIDAGTCSTHYYESQIAATKTLVLLHGLGTSSSTWIHVFPQLIKRFHVVAVDLPGFGFSSLKNGGEFLSFGELSDVLIQILPRITSTPFTLIGHSLGGWLAMDYAIRSPELVQRVILINPAGILYPGIEEQQNVFEISNLRSLYIFLGRLWWKYPWYFKPFAPAILHDLTKRKVVQFVRSIQGKDFLNERLCTLRKPAHLIWGRNDGVISQQTVQVLKTEVPQIDLNFIDRCGHVPQLERPAELLKILDGVL